MCKAIHTNIKSELQMVFNNQMHSYKVIYEFRNR
jgi:hypothetical protein